MSKAISLTLRLGWGTGSGNLEEYILSGNDLTFFTLNLHLLIIAIRDDNGGAQIFTRTRQYIEIHINRHLTPFHSIPLFYLDLKSFTLQFNGINPTMNEALIYLLFFTSHRNLGLKYGLKYFLFSFLLC